MKKISSIKLPGQIGKCGHLLVFLGFAPARILFKHSFADCLNEDTGLGYQRPLNRAHAKNFRQYIDIPTSSTIPLTFNLRPDFANLWKLNRNKNGTAELIIKADSCCLAQVDCQHRLGEMSESDISFAFMTFIGLDLRSEMALFNVINSRAKGLSSSLTDYHQTRLMNDLAQEAPHLLIAKRLNEDANSPWFKMVRYGGETTSGLMRRTSFRMLQTTIRKLLKRFHELNRGDIEVQYQIICQYWNAVKTVFPKDWGNHRHSLLTKGVGLYSLMELLGDLIGTMPNMPGDSFFQNNIRKLSDTVDWDSKGMFANAGGRKGAHEVYIVLKKAVFS